MFPEKYKHHSRRPQGIFAKLASKANALVKRNTAVSETADGWVI